MLVLSRRSGESIIISDNIELKIVEIKGDYVKLGITAPRAIPVHRKEVFEAIQRENAHAAETKKKDVKELEQSMPTKPDTGKGRKEREKERRKEKGKEQ